MYRQIHLHGYLADEYGNTLRLNVNSVAQLCRCMEANFRNFYDKIRDGEFHIIVGNKLEKGYDLCEEQLKQSLGFAEDVHIVPVIAGASGKSGGFFQIILGVVLIAAAVVTGSIMLGMAGVILALGGIVNLLTPKVQGNTNSYLFNGPLNPVVQGGAVSIVYGEMMCDATLIASGLSNAQLLDNPLTTNQTSGYAGALAGHVVVSIETLPDGITISPTPTIAAALNTGWIPSQNAGWYVSVGGNFTLTITCDSSHTLVGVYVDSVNQYTSGNPFVLTLTNLQVKHRISIAAV
jgi:predicted phage tail protein